MGIEPKVKPETRFLGSNLFQIISALTINYQLSTINYPMDFF